MVLEAGGAREAAEPLGDRGAGVVEAMHWVPQAAAAAAAMAPAAVAGALDAAACWR